MDLKFEGEYKSIKNFEWKDIPQMAIITGKNGTGKSQLLDVFKAAIEKSWNWLDHVNPSPTGQTSNKKPNKVPFIGKEKFKNEDLVFLRGEWLINNLSPVGLSNLQSERKNLFKKFMSRAGQLRSLSIEDIKVDIENFKYHTMYSNIYSYFDQMILSFIEKGIEFNEENYAKYLPNFVIPDLRDQASNRNIAKAFYNYKLDLIEYKDDAEKNIRIEESEKPWNLVNQLFSEIHLPFEINNPDNLGIRDIYTPKIKDLRTDEEIDLIDLSSGEKVLMSLVFWLFNSEQFEAFPKLLVLDEPDAHLHPTMTKEFLHVLKNVLCDKYGVRVIMTTHSPSTVALAPEDSLYLMKNDGDRIEKTMKDIALNILTEGIPSLSINYENRRQVFVESSNDVKFYDIFYKKLQDYLEPEISLTFISSGESKKSKGTKVANCGQVKNICKILRESGNDKIWGIIDWDTTNKPDEFEYIHVLGDKINPRYAIDNYILDPILLAALLEREKLEEKSNLGLQENENFYDFKNFDELKLQLIADHILQKISSDHKKITEFDVIKVYYVNGKSINLPKWYFITQGHDLENIILKTFPKLNAIKKNQEELLKLAVLEKVVDDLPDFIPQDILDAFTHVQNF